jgi:hypothetical protein
VAFWNDIGNAIAGAADAVAGAVETAVNAVEEVVTDAVESVGNAVSDVAAAVGDAAGAIPVVGPALSAVAHWAGDVVSSITDLAGAVIKSVFGILGKLTAGLVRVVFGGIGGLLAWDASMLLKGLGDIASGFTGGVVAVGGKFIALVQSVIPLQPGERRLTPFEIQVLRRVYRRSLGLYNIRIVPGFAGVFSINTRPFTLDNTIYLKGIDPTVDPHTLVHEAAHVWQYQNRGTRYLTDAISAQWFVRDAYSWEVELSRGKTQWQEFNAEAQGQFLEDVHRHGTLVGGAGTSGEFYNDDPIGNNVQFIFGGTNCTDLARAAVAYVRGAFSWRPSELFTAGEAEFELLEATVPEGIG